MASKRASRQKSKPPETGERDPGGRNPAEQVDAVLIAALAVGASQQDAAEQAGVGAALVRDRLADPAFRKRLDEAQQDLIDRTLGVAVSNCTAAMQRIRDLMACPDPAVALRAAVAVIDQTVKLRDSAALRRLAAIEAKLEGRQP